MVVCYIAKYFTKVICHSVAYGFRISNIVIINI